MGGLEIELGSPSNVLITKLSLLKAQKILVQANEVKRKKKKREKKKREMKKKRRDMTRSRLVLDACLGHENAYGWACSL